jgi:hypothetical protein
MNDEPSSNPDFLTRLESLANGRTRVPYREFESLFKELGNASIPVSHLHQVLNFTSDQLGLWEAQWLFSPAHSPNTLAKTEVERWRILWQALFDSLAEKVPDTRALLEREQQLRLLQHSLQRGVEFNKTKPLRKVTAIVLSQASFVLNRIGLHGIARNLYAWGLYPKGTVARP